MRGVVEPVLDHVGAERARLVNAERVRLVSSEPAVTIDVVATTTRRSRAAVRQWVRRHRKAGRMVAVTNQGAVLVPSFQLDDAFGVDEEVAGVVAYLVGHRMSDWAVWGWFVTANTWLDGRTPVDVLEAGDVTALRRAAAGMFQE